LTFANIVCKLHYVSPLSPLLTDLYQLTMAYGYWRHGMARREAVFHLFFRRSPFDGGFALAAGLAQAIEFLEGLRFAGDDLAYLETLQGNDGQRMFAPEFLDYLRDLQLTLHVDAIPEGTAVFAQEPLVRVRGALLEAQLIETALLNIVNFQTLIATKAARVCLAARGLPVVDFGLRRAQGPDGGLSASRAAYLGGCDGTSNVLAGKTFGIPVRGTHAHSWVMAFDDEVSAFEAYAQAMPNNSTLLVDTYDTLEGVRRAVETGRRLRERGHELAGIRLDSGDLAWLSKAARQILDEGGFPDAKIVASNDLDETVIASLLEQGARIDIWGVGTRLVTAYDQPALGAVYKLGAIRDAAGRWQPVLKVSEQAAKTSTPGVLQVRRFTVDGVRRGDAIYDVSDGIGGNVTMVDPLDPTRRRTFGSAVEHTDLLVPVFREGRRVMEMPTLAASREHAADELAHLDPTITRLLNPHTYPVGLERTLHDRRTRLVLEARGER
jgi:nicotinate phosphoribosyltransferase